MDSVLTLVAAPGEIDDTIVTTAASVLSQLGADVASPQWLAPARAADLPFSLLANEQAEAAVRHAFKGRPIDLVALPATGRRKQLLLADMDSTMVTIETLDELADFAGLKAPIAAITEQSMSGTVDFTMAIRERVALLAGLSTAYLEQAYERVSYTPGGCELVTTMRTHGAHTILVSGGFSFFTGRVRAHCGFDADRSNHFEIENGKLTGKVRDPVLDRGAKLRALVEAAAERHIPLSAAMTVGDGANDLEMIKAAGLGIAFHAMPIVKAAARFRVDHGDLRTLLYYQGYRDEEITG